MADGTADRPRYHAFISYSHRDAACGRRLHRRLEGYRLPKRLVGRPGRLGPTPTRLSPIFRDREELSAAGDLSAEVRAALAASAVLVVVCSPSAAASPWVGREIETFRTLHPDRPVLAAVISGEPVDCFPEALRTGGLEPLAADFRKAGDGPRLGLLKLAAGIAGVGLDELVQRDAQRQVASVTAITAGALTLTLVMAAMTAVALDARAEAERQRAEAEGLVEFMLGDLRDKLEGVAQLEVLTTVNRRALAHYAGQDLKQLSPKELESRARILHAMGEDDERRDDLPRALQQFQEARRTTAALLAADPRNPDRIFNHAQSEYYVALIDWRQERFEAARAGFERYAALAARLLAADDKKPEWLMEAGYAQTNLGMMALRDTGDAASARAHFLRTLAYFSAAERARPRDVEVLRMKADTYAWLADSQRALGLYPDARSSRRQEAEILTSLRSADPNSAVYARDLLGNALGSAQIDLDDRQAEAARSRLDGAYREATRLAAADPADAKLRKQRTVLGLFLAKTLLAGGDRAQSGRAEALLTDCGTSLSETDQELRDLCAIVRIEAATALGRRDVVAETYVNAHRDRMSKTTRTPRWGVDVARWLAALED